MLRDDYIGETEIDIETRYFDEKWQAIPHYPIETRSLYKDQSSVPTGRIRLWIEIFDPEEVKIREQKKLARRESLQMNSQRSLARGAEVQVEKTDNLKVTPEDSSPKPVPKDGVGTPSEKKPLVAEEKKDPERELRLKGIFRHRWDISLMTPEELELTEWVSGRSFKGIPIHQGKRILMDKQISWLNRLLTRERPYKEVGLFRAGVELIDERTLKDIQALGVPGYLERFGLPSSADGFSQDTMDRRILQERTVVIRLYIIDAEIYEDTDIGSDPDPYLVIKLGDRVIDDRKGYVSDRKSPMFYKLFE